MAIWQEGGERICLFLSVIFMNICLHPAISPDTGLSPGPLQSVGVADQLVQHVDDLSELWPVGPLPLPAVQHELVERHGAVHGRGQPIALINSLDHLDSTPMLL